MKIFVIIYLALMFARLNDFYPILKKIQLQKNCRENWDWEVFSRAFLFRQKHFGFDCYKKSLENKLRIEQEERRQQKLKDEKEERHRFIFRNRVEARLTASSILRDFYSGRF
jgi:hypothetical protein